MGTWNEYIIDEGRPPEWPYPVKFGEERQVDVDVLVIGGFGNDRTDLLCSGSRAEIEACVEKLVAEAGTTGVIIGADCTTHLDTPDEHLHWVYEKAKSLGGE